MKVKDIDFVKFGVMLVALLVAGSLLVFIDHRNVPFNVTFLWPLFIFALIGGVFWFLFRSAGENGRRERIIGIVVGILLTLLIIGMLPRVEWSDGTSAFLYSLLAVFTVLIAAYAASAVVLRVPKHSKANAVPSDFDIVPTSSESSSDDPTREGN